MREAIDHRPLVPPTPGQAALLSVLQMRESLDKDELARAAQQMAGCSVSLSVLDDLAKRHKIPGTFNREMFATDLQVAFEMRAVFGEMRQAVFRIKETQICGPLFGLLAPLWRVLGRRGICGPCFLRGIVVF